jgi:hypothetical protein
MAPDGGDPRQHLPSTRDRGGDRRRGRGTGGADSDDAMAEAAEHRGDQPNGRNARSARPPWKALNLVGELVRVEAPKFTAGLIMRGDRCVYAAPILRWACGMRREALRASLARKKFKATIVECEDLSSHKQSEDEEADKQDVKLIAFHHQDALPWNR